MYYYLTHFYTEPSAAPVNVRGHNTSSTSILVQWGNVPAEDRNGKILSYTVTYKVGEGDALTKVVNAPATQTTLSGLNEHTEYSITVFASTSKGGGTANEPAIKVTTDEDSKYLDREPLILLCCTKKVCVQMSSNVHDL